MLKKAYENALFGIAIFVAAFTIFHIVSNLSEPRILFVNGFSMYPAYLPFDMLLVEDVKPEEIKYGDVVVLDNSVSWMPYKNYVAHRVNWIKIDHDIVIGTQGDNNPESDGLTDANEIIGRISHRIPLVGYVLAPPFSYGVILGAALILLSSKKIIVRQKR